MLINSVFLKYRKTPLLFVLLSFMGYYWFAYQTERTESTQVLLLYTLLFGLAYALKKSGGFNFRLLMVSAILIRLLFLVAIPNLSQDFYRFLWDGRMILEGFNPYLHTPESFISNGQFPVPQAQELYNGMGQLNASHFSNYPPLNQLCFILASLFFKDSILGSVIGLRLIIILADLGIIYFGKLLLEALKLPSSRIWWYALNPFIIIELTGNLHFEGVMLFFLIWSFYLMHKRKYILSAILFGCSVSVKLIPLMFLPLFFWWFIKRKNSKNEIRQLIQFYCITIITVIVLFLPFYSSAFITNYSNTVGLWFTKFEFNASIYYLAREIGFLISGYNEIAVIGKVLPLMTILIILFFAFGKRHSTLPKLVSSIVIIFSCYLFLSTTVHPWYLATLVMLCIFTNYRFPLLWSFVIILSYISYVSIGNADKTENMWVVGLEYIIVFSAFIWEVLLKQRLKVLHF